MSLGRWLLLLTGLLFGTASLGQAVSDVPPDKFRDLTIPFDSRLVLHFFGPASPPDGEHAVFAANGSVLLFITREAPGLPREARVTLTIQDAAGRVLGSWAGATGGPGMAAVIKRVDLPATANTLGVKVVDHADGGPTRNRPYTIRIEAWPLSASSAIQALSTQRPVAPTPNGCRFVATPSRNPEYLELSHRVALAGLPGQVPVPKVLTAGGYLLVDTSPDVAPGTIVRLRILAKHSDDGPYVTVCDGIRLQAARTGRLEASQSGLDQQSLWRIETTLEGESGSARAGEIQVWREKMLANPDPSRAEPWNNGRGLVCFDRLTNRVAVAPTRNQFAGRTRLNVRLPDSASFRLTPEQRTAVSTTVLHAASLWVRACVLCKPDNLAVIDVDGKLFVHPGLAELSMPRGAAPPPPGLAPPDSQALERMLNSLLGTSRVGIATPFLAYREVPSNSPQFFARLCAASSSEQHTPTLKGIQAAVCGAPPAPGSIANIRVMFRPNGQTACGSDKDVVGCRADNELTEYNTRHYRFSAPGATLGTGDVELDLLQVVMHEMGHWIGLEHLDQGESIMASSVERARCIDFETVKALAEQIAVTQGTPKPHAPSAFRLRAPR